MDLGVDACMLAERIIVAHELAAGLLVQTRLGEGHNEKALDDLKDVFERPLGRVPVSLEGVYADFARVLGHVRMENLRQEEPFRCALREPVLNNEFATENASFVGGLDWSDDVGLDVEHIALFVLVKDDSIGRVSDQLELLFGEQVEHAGIHVPSSSLASSHFLSVRIRSIKCKDVGVVF